MTRAQMKQAFLAAHGWDGAEIQPLAGDASNRRYDRVRDQDRGAVLMDAAPDAGEDVRPFIRVTQALRGRGLSAPEILAADAGCGFLLLEDLGDALFARVCDANPAAEDELYAAAVDLLTELHQAPVPDWLLPYDDAVLWRETRLVADWYLPAAAPDADHAAAATALEAAFRDCLAPMRAQRPVWVLRDFHAENLLWLPGRDGVKRVGLLDYQDALAGHPAYDLVSLLEDARRDTTPELRAAMTDRYLTRTGHHVGSFRAALAALGAQRNLKIIGIFARLCIRDGKAQYPTLIPRVYAHLMRDLAHPGLAPLRDWANRWLPAPGDRIVSAIVKRGAEQAGQAARASRMRAGAKACPPAGMGRDTE